MNCGSASNIPRTFTKELLLETSTCCLDDDGHLAIPGIKLSCNCNACHECIDINAKGNERYCFCHRCKKISKIDRNFNNQETPESKRLLDANMENLVLYYENMVNELKKELTGKSLGLSILRSFKYFLFYFSEDLKDESLNKTVNTVNEQIKEKACKMCYKLEKFYNEYKEDLSVTKNELNR
jgi:hypothetical protein